MEILKEQCLILEDLHLLCSEISGRPRQMPEGSELWGLEFEDSFFNVLGACLPSWPHKCTRTSFPETYATRAIYR